MIEFEIKGINITDTFECGQCFRWNRIADNAYEGVAGIHPAQIQQHGDIICIDSPHKDERFWSRYLDSTRDYAKIAQAVSISKEMQIAATSGSGIRILRQDSWETICSFIISQNNNIPRIKGIIERLCEQFGTKLGNHYSFPSPHDILGKDLSAIRAGFREKYLQDAAEKAANGFLNDSEKMDTETLRNHLKQIKGIGDKVADCTLLFAYGRHEVFPQDVWIKRIMAEYLQDKITPEQFGKHAGIAQQYLFHYYRNKRFRKLA